MGSAAPGDNGDAIATAAADMTGAEFAFQLRSMRGWESADECAAGACHVGFAWHDGSTHDVHCVVLHQGEEGFHATVIVLQRKDSMGHWVEVMQWQSIPEGRTKLAVHCPAIPTVAYGQVDTCQGNGTSQECAVQCAAGYGTVEPKLRCVNGAWYVPECLEVGSMLRVVALAPNLIKPYWVVMHARLFTDAECTQAMEMNGAAFSSGEFVVKYASYHPKQIWDGSEETSWAAKEPCTPGSCYVGFRFAKKPAKDPKCVQVEHPKAKQYQATKVALEVLGAGGWEIAPPDVVVQLLPKPASQEL